MAQKIKTVLVGVAIGLLAVVSFLLGRGSSPAPRVVIPEVEVKKARQKAEAKTTARSEEIRQEMKGKTVGELVDFLNERAKKERK